MPTNTASSSTNISPYQQGDSVVEKRFERLEVALQHMGGTVLATTEAVECLAERVDALATKVQQQNQHLETIDREVQTIKINQQQSSADLNKLKRIFKNLFKANKKNNQD